MGDKPNWRMFTTPQRFIKPYPPDYRAEAVRLVKEGGRSVREVAGSLGVSYEALRLWIRQTDPDAGVRKDGLTSDEREELRRL